jgi:hypothetical protein
MFKKVEANRPQTAIKYDKEMMRYAYRIFEATDTHANYVCWLILHTNNS